MEMLKAFRFKISCSFLKTHLVEARELNNQRKKKSRDYVYGIWQYKVFDIKRYVPVKNIWDYNFFFLD